MQEVHLHAIEHQDRAAVRAVARVDVGARALCGHECALEIAREHSDIGVEHRALCDVVVEELRRHDAFHRQHLDAFALALDAQRLDRCARSQLHGPRDSFVWHRADSLAVADTPRGLDFACFLGWHT